MTLRDRINRRLDALVRPEIRTPLGSASAFRLCGALGFVGGGALAMGIVAHRHLSALVMIAVVVGGVTAFLVLAMVTKIVTGEEKLTYYHNAIGVMGAAVLLLRLLRQPVLPYADALMLGLGAMHIGVRAGCLLAGCCHGRPHRFGVRYRREHAAAGFPEHYVGVRLFPVQLVELLWIAAAVAIGVAIIRRGAPAGGALAWYVVAYSLGRFAFELARGDEDRRHAWGFSEAQWTAVLLTWTVVLAEWVRVLPASSWHAGAAVGLLFAMPALHIHRARHGVRWALLHPRHVREIAGYLRGESAALARDDGNEPRQRHPPSVSCTSRGLRISSGVVRWRGSPAEHHALSLAPEPLSAPLARTLAELIVRLRGPVRTVGLIEGRGGVFHLLLR